MHSPSTHLITLCSLLAVALLLALPGATSSQEQRHASAAQPEKELLDASWPGVAVSAVLVATRVSGLLLVSYFLFCLLRNTILVPLMFVPSVMLSQMPAFQTERSQRFTHLCAREPDVEVVTTRTSDQQQLQGMCWRHPSQTCLPAAQQRYVLFFNPNAASYEDVAEFLVYYGREVGCNVACFNYRGTSSQLRSASPKTMADLILDGRAAMQYLTDQGIEPTNVLLHGHSMGGSVAVAVRGDSPEGPLIHDRSFRSFFGVVQATLQRAPPLAGIVFGLMGSWVGFLFSVGVLDVNFGSVIMYMFQGLVLFGVTGFFGARYLSGCVRLFLWAIGWHVPVSRFWDSITGSRVVLYHPLDVVIPHPDASLAGCLARRTKDAQKDIRVIQLSGLNSPNDHQPSQFYHCYPLSMYRSDWAEVVHCAQKALRLTTTTTTAAATTGSHLHTVASSMSSVSSPGAHSVQPFSGVAHRLVSSIEEMD